MKTFELKKKSWHYWLANFGNERVYQDSDICSYIRYVIYGTALFTLAVTAGAFVAGTIIFLLGNLFSWLFLGYQLHEVTITVFTVIFIFALVPAFFIGKQRFESNIRNNEPGFVRLAYRSWKDKFCARIELK